MSEDQLRIVSTSTIKVASAARINLTPSDLELLFLEYAQLGLLFPKPTLLLQTSILARSNSGTSLIHHLRASLEHTLNAFPPLAGRLATASSPDGAATSFFIDCSHHDGGSLFIHAINNTLAAADIHGTTHSLFPLTGAPNYDGVPRPLLAVQVTELVDGLFIGVSTNQLLFDATSLRHFLSSWAQISLGEGPISPLPFLDRDEVNLDLAGSRTIYIDNKHLIPQANPVNIQPQISLTDRTFHLSKQNIAKLKARANRELWEISGGKISSLQAVIAHVWRSIIRCRSAMNLCPQETTFEVPMCIRQRLDPPLPPEYFGNATIPGIVTLEARQILENSLGWTAWQINRTVAYYSDSEKIKCFFRNWIEKPKFLGAVPPPSNYFVLLNSPRFNFNGIDFGWGKPGAIRGGMSDCFDGRITTFGGSEEGSIDVEVCSFAETLSCLADDRGFMEFVTPKCCGLSKL